MRKGIRILKCIWLRGVFAGAALSVVSGWELYGDEVEAPAAFKTNCQACHELDRALVGPSLVEISELYPEQSRADFIKWCIEPGRKREMMPQMPSMVHIPENELSKIFDYIKEVSIGVKRVKSPRTDPFATHPESIRRPRVERTFLPESGPASILVALPTSKKHNLVWDTDKCRLRYISEGETSRWPYLRSNGNALAKVGEVRYREVDPLFVSGEVAFKGYRIDDNGYPTFVYTVGEATVWESISVERETVVRRISATPGLPEFRSVEGRNESLETESQMNEGVLTITHRAR